MSDNSEEREPTLHDNELENYITGPLRGIIEARTEAYDTLGNMEIQYIDSTVVRLSVAPLTPLLLSLQYEQQEEARVAAHNKQVAECSRPFKRYIVSTCDDDRVKPDLPGRRACWVEHSYCTGRVGIAVH